MKKRTFVSNNFENLPRTEDLKMTPKLFRISKLTKICFVAREVYQIVNQHVTATFLKQLRKSYSLQRMLIRAIILYKKVQGTPSLVYLEPVQPEKDKRPSQKSIWLLNQLMEIQAFLKQF